MTTHTNIIIVLAIFNLLVISTGIIFCNVESNNKTNNLKDLDKDKNHPWKGAAPILIIILVIISNSKEYIYFIRQSNTEIIYRIEAALWIKKYFIEFSIGEYSLDVIIGRNLSILSSSLTHIIILELLLTAINNLVINVNLNLIRGLKIIILIRNLISSHY